jgi:hypothetical protein
VDGGLNHHSVFIIISRRQKMTKTRQLTLMVLVVNCLCIGCSKYVAPGAGVNLMKAFTEADKQTLSADAAFIDSDFNRIYQRKPVSSLPARIAIARVQAPCYQSYTAKAYGNGNYSVLLVRDVETDEDFERLEKLPEISYISPLNRLLLPERLETDRELRLAAAALNADMLLIYTIETEFRSEDQATPLSVVTLGLSPSVVVFVNSTASALLMDTRTGFVYGAAEKNADRQQIAAWWTNEDAIDQCRRRTERTAFENLITEFESLWPHVVTERKIALAQSQTVNTTYPTYYTK